jgi:AcrR family transcriptional regulator
VTDKTRRQQRRGVERRSRAGPNASRREEILQAARELFSANGVRAVSTRQIASAVGISQPSLYAHFATREDLVQAAFVSAFDKLAAHLRVVASRRTGLELVRDLCRAYISFGLDHPDAYRLAFLSEFASEDPYADRAFKAGLNAFDIFLGAVEGVRAPAGDARLVAESLWAAMHGLASLLIQRPQFPWSDLETLIDRHIERNLAAETNVP